MRVAERVVVGATVAAILVATAAPAAPVLPGPVATSRDRVPQGGVTAATPAGATASPARASRAAATRRIRFSLVATVPGRYGTYSPWSPSAPLVAYSDAAGVAVLDVEQPSPKPVRVVVGIDTDCTWSPDGGWILARTPSRHPDARGAALVVVQATGGGETIVADDVLVSDFTWAADGKIYYWDYERAQPHAIAPPAAWSRQHPGPFTGRPILVFAFGGGAPVATYFDVGDLPVARMLAPLASLPRSVLRADGFPDGRLLVRVSGDMDGGHGSNHIFDATGSVVGQVPASLDGATFAATAVSGDGTFVAGEQVADSGDAILSATLYLVATDAAWSARVEGVEWGTNPRLSRVGSWLAFTDADGEAHVGSLTLGP
jgi:hypothetical protein